jgi:hypothetical protein
LSGLRPWFHHRAGWLLNLKKQPFVRPEPKWLLCVYCVEKPGFGFEVLRDPLHEALFLRAMVAVTCDLACFLREAYIAQMWR